MKIIIVGKGGSGKDHLKKHLIQMGYKPSVSHTTRPIRQGEVPGEDYLYFSQEEFFRNRDNGVFEEWDSFNGWNYATPKANFRECQVFVMTPGVISSLAPWIRESSVIVYLDINEEERRKRLGKRNINGIHDIVDRRIAADDKDFQNFFDFDLRIRSPYFSPSDVEFLIKELWKISI